MHSRMPLLIKVFANIVGEMYLSCTCTVFIYTNHDHWEEIDGIFFVSVSAWVGLLYNSMSLIFFIPSGWTADDVIPVSTSNVIGRSSVGCFDQEPKYRRNTVGWIHYIGLKWSARGLSCWTVCSRCEFVNKSSTYCRTAPGIGIPCTYRWSLFVTMQLAHNVMACGEHNK